MTQTTTDTIERTITIAARPETVFNLLTDPARMTEWMGRSVAAEPRPGGLIRVDYNGFDVMRGEFVEVTPYSRVVYTFGWESLAADRLRPGASTVEFSLSPEGDGTILRLVHRGLPELARPGHDEGWEMFLTQLAARASGAAGLPTDVRLSAGEELASRLNTLLIQLRDAIEECSDRQWKAITSERWSVGVTAHHAVSHIGLAHAARAVGAGEPSPLAGFTADMITRANARHAVEFASVSRAETIAQVQDEGPAAVDALRGMTDAELAKTAAMGFAGGAQVSARQVIEGPLLSDIAAHLESIRAAARGA